MASLLLWIPTPNVLKFSNRRLINGTFNREIKQNNFFNCWKLPLGQSAANSYIIVNVRRVQRLDINRTSK